MTKQQIGHREKPTQKGPEFLRFVVPLLNVLKDNGGAGTASEIIEKVLDKCQISEEEREIKMNSGDSRTKNQVQWAKFYLSKTGYLDSSQRGIWKLTEKGFEDNHRSEHSVYNIFLSVQGKETIPENVTQVSLIDTSVDKEAVREEAHTEKLIEILQQLPPSGFERICKRLLMEIGIEDVVITGKANDQGIDGTGIIKLNEVVGFNLIFQCKRYKETISPHLIRDFRGAMQGRADKGLFITTGRFTSEARKEATRDGVPPIELIDGDRLVGLFEKYQLGLKPITVFEIIPSFFDNFKD